MSNPAGTGRTIPITWTRGRCTARPAPRTPDCIPRSRLWESGIISRRASIRHRIPASKAWRTTPTVIPTREEVAADLTAGRTLANALEAAGITRVDVVGLAESHCVKETALDARKLGYETHVIEELTEPVSEELGVDARRQMREAGVVLD